MHKFRRVLSSARTWASAVCKAKGHLWDPLQPQKADAIERSPERLYCYGMLWLYLSVLYTATLYRLCWYRMERKKYKQAGTTMAALQTVPHPQAVHILYCSAEVVGRWLDSFTYTEYEEIWGRYRRIRRLGFGPSCQCHCSVHFAQVHLGPELAELVGLELVELALDLVRWNPIPSPNLQGFLRSQSHLCSTHWHQSSCLEFEGPFRPFRAVRPLWSSNWAGRAQGAWRYLLHLWLVPLVHLQCLVLQQCLRS